MQSYEKQINALDKQIDNLLNLAAHTGSKSLVEKLELLEQNKAQMKFRLETFETAENAKGITEDEIRKWFSTARTLFLERSLTTSKKLIDLFVDKVTVFDNHVKLVIKIKPDLSLPTKESDKSSSTTAGDTHLCALVGAEGGT